VERIVEPSVEADRSCIRFTAVRPFETRQAVDAEQRKLSSTD